jgi:hypothetical protein
LINQEILADGNLLDKKTHEKLQEYLTGFNAFLMLIKSDLEKSFGYFIPSNMDFKG